MITHSILEPSNGLINKDGVSTETNSRSIGSCIGRFFKRIFSCGKGKDTHHKVDRMYDETEPLIHTVEKKADVAEESSSQELRERKCSWLRTNSRTAIVKSVGVVSLVASAILSWQVSTLFYENDNNAQKNLVLGATLGFAADICANTLAPEKIARLVGDFISNYAYEGITVATQLYLNGLCPLEKCSVWNPSNPPLQVERGFSTGFSFLAGMYIAQSLRPLLLKSKIYDTDASCCGNYIDGPADENGQEVPDGRIKLFLETTSPSSIKAFIGEQTAQVALGGVCLIADRIFAHLPEIVRYSGYYWLGSAVGSVALKGYYALKRLEMRYYAEKEGVEVSQIPRYLLKTVSIIGTIVENASLGLIFAWEDDSSFILVGAVASGAKMSALYQFEHIRHNKFHGNRFRITDITNVIKAPLLLGGLAWYIVGLTDSNIVGDDIANILLYLGSAVATYVITRNIATRYSPNQELELASKFSNRIANSLFFYFVDQQQYLYLPYMFIRSAQQLGDRENREITAKFIEAIAWISLGAGAGGNRARQGLYKEHSPQLMSDLANLIGYYILASGGKLR